MGDRDIDALVREGRRAERGGHDACCQECGDTRHLCRTADGRLVCYSCRRLATGGSATERDHIAGRANLGGLLVDLRANDHRTVTEMRLRLGIDGWSPAEGDPLMTLAHVLAGI